MLEDVPTSQIPEISWEPISEEVMAEWWQTDAIAKKVLHLVIRNLVSHLVDKPGEVICSVTPMGADVIQVALVFDSLEEGAPYAFAVIKDDSSIKGIPIFSTGTYELQSDGILVTKKMVFLKNYCITRNGEMVDIQGTGQTIQFIKPIYSTVISGRYQEPMIYETRQS